MQLEAVKSDCEATDEQEVELEEGEEKEYLRKNPVTKKKSSLCLLSISLFCLPPSPYLLDP